MAKRAISKSVRVAAMKEYVADGKTLREVSEKFNISPETLRRWLGDKVRPRGLHLKGKKRPMYPTRVEKTDIVSRKVRTSKASDINNRSNKRWTKMEDELLRDAVLSKMTVKETVELLGRTPIAIYCRKSILIDNGFMNEDTRFKVAPGIKRTHKTDKTDNVYSEVEIEKVIQPEETKEVQVDVENSTETPLSSPSIELSDLAKLVKEFGVNITVSVTSKGMEVKMC